MIDVMEEKDIQMWDDILHFMQEQDPGRSWIDAMEGTPVEFAFVYETLNQWLDDGMKESPTITVYRAWLLSMVSGGLW